MASSKKGSSSKGAGVHTCFLIFEKKLIKVERIMFGFIKWKMTDILLMQKRSPIKGSDISDIINRFNNLEDEINRSRKRKIFYGAC